MAKVKILKPGETYTFRRYFELRFPPAAILQELGASLTRAEIAAPKDVEVPQDRLDDLRQRLEKAIARVSLTSESARREALVFPVLLEVAEITQARIDIEFPLEVDTYLRGDLDYYLQAHHHLLVVEAKQADLTRGFTQLAAELIALDRWTDLDDLILYGAVTTGDIWQFGCFRRQEKQIVQDKNLYRVPADLAEVLHLLVGMLSY
ncbi:hypothetical protein [Leptodesmis sp.]|uniref:hypothetical protein n=1 Tax=Leptodesmis sp. TaxID=3100501 RepID=UPI0040535340